MQRGTRNRARPSRPVERGTARASSTPTSPLPLEMNCLRPLMRHVPSGWRVAVVPMLPTSEPASGSVIATQPMISPRPSRGTQRCFWESDPKRRIIAAGLI